MASSTTFILWVRGEERLQSASEKVASCNPQLRRLGVNFLVESLLFAYQSL